jgi:hypothetical protein
VITAQHIALLCLGEIGRRVNLEKQDALQKIIFSAFESSSEEVKACCSFPRLAIDIDHRQTDL